MSEIIFEIISRSITLKAKQQREEEGKALLSCTKSKIKEKTNKKQNKNFYISGLRWIMEEFGKEFLCYCPYGRSRC